MFLNGFVHALLPIAGVSAFSMLGGDAGLFSSTGLIVVFAVLMLGSFAINYMSLSIVQSNVCGKVFQPGHLATLSAYGMCCALLFVAAAMGIPFLWQSVANFLPVEDFPEEQIATAVMSFYAFWAGMYSSAGFSWFATACPATPIDTKPIIPGAPI